MRILGADAFVGKDTAINAIPVNYLTHGDVCFVKIDNSDPAYQSAIYFYEYITNDGNDQNLPFVITPLDQFDINLQTTTEGDGDDGGRWKLKDIFTNKLLSGEVVTDTISSLTSGGLISIGNDLTVDSNGIIVDGQVNINSSIYEPPLIVNSDVMVQNLNSQYLGGETFDHFLKNDNNQLSIPIGTSELVVYMTFPMLNPPHYSIMIDICNLIDDIPSIYGFTITDKQQDRFTVKFSGEIDSSNYVLHYFMIGDSESTTTPSSGSPSGSPEPSPYSRDGVVWTSDIPLVAVVGTGYLIDTSVSSVSISLPVNPSDGNFVAFIDASSTFGTNNFTVLRNGKLIMGLDEDMIVSDNNAAFELVYNGTTGDWRLGYVTV